MTNMIARSQPEQPSKKTKDIYTYTVLLRSKALDYEGVPEDTQKVTIHLYEYPFPHEIANAVKFWLDLGYELVDKWMILHQRFDPQKKHLVDIWNPPMEM